MKISTQSGCKVIYARESRTSPEKEIERKHLKLGSSYTVVKVDTQYGKVVYLEEVPGTAFSVTLFDDEISETGLGSDGKINLRLTSGENKLLISAMPEISSSENENTEAQTAKNISDLYDKLRNNPDLRGILEKHGLNMEALREMRNELSDRKDYSDDNV